MKPSITRNLLSASLMMMAINAMAIITDPDDYIIYDSGILGDSVFATEQFSTQSEYVSFHPTADMYVGYAGVLGSGVEPAEMGLPSSAVKGVSRCFGWIIPQDNANKKGPFKISALDWKKNRGITPEQKTQYLWYYNKDINYYSRPSDSLIIRVPAYCDSFYIQTGGVNEVSYGVAAYEGWRQRNESNYYFTGNNWGLFKTLSFKPVVRDGDDSVDIVILATHKDYFVTLAEMEWTDHNSTRGEQVFDALATCYKGQRWGLFEPININRIKIYGKIERGEVPPFEGTVFGWTNRYRPKPSGTVDLSYKLTESDVETARYAKFASDLGIVRVILTTSQSEGMLLGYDDALKEFVTTVDGLAADPVDGDGFALKPDSFRYENDSFHRNWFQMSGTATGCQEMSLDFDFVIRNGNPAEYPDSIAVAVQRKGDSKWVVLGFAKNAYTFENESDTEGTPCLSHVHFQLPDSLMANQSFLIRILPAYLENAGSSLSVANLTVSGFDDFYAKDDNAPTIAYISNANDRIHLLNRAATADSTDLLLKRLLQGSQYRIKLFTQAETASLTTEESVREAFSDCDMVILSEYPASGADIVKNARALIGYKPFLNLKAFACKNWESDFKPTDGNSDSLALVASNFMIHPLFKDITLEESDHDEMLVTPSLFDDCSQDGNYLQGITFDATPAGYCIARGINSQAVSIYEDYSNDRAKYLMLAISATQNSHLTETADKLLDNAISYLLSDGHFEAPDFNLNSTGAIVDNMKELKAAAVYDFKVIGVDDPVIQLKPSTDAGAVYDLSQLTAIGNGKLTLKSYSSAQKAILKGSLALTDARFTSLCFNDCVFQDSEAAPFVLTGKTQVSDNITFKNCELSGIPSLFTTAGADSASVKTLIVNGCHFTQSANGGILVDMQATSRYAVDSISVTENVFDRCMPATWFSLKGNSQSTAAALLMNHNIFYQDASPQSSVLVGFEPETAPDCHLSFTNNIFHQAGPADIVLSASAGSGSRTLSRNNLFIGGFPQWSSSDDLGLSDLGETGIFENGLTLDKTSAFYTGGTSRSYLGAISAYSLRTQPRTVRVSNVPELKTAIEIAIGGDVIELEDYSLNEDDSCDVYFLGTNGFPYPRLQGTLTIRAAEGADPKLFGCIYSSGKQRSDTLLYENLTWVDSTWFDGYEKEGYNPFFFNFSNDTIAGALILRGCNFYDQQAQVTVRSRTAAAGSYYGAVIIEGCRFHNNGGSAEDGKVGGHLIQFDASAAYSLNKFVFTDNIVSRFHGSQMFNVTRSGSTSDLNFDIIIDNNLFYMVGGNATDRVRNFLEFNTVASGSTVNISIADNIFYKRWSSNNLPVANLSLFAADSTVKSSIVVSHNFFEGKYYTGDEILTPNPMALTDSTMNLRMVDVKGNQPEPGEESLLVSIVRDNDLFAAHLGIENVFYDENNLIISEESPLFTAGRNGGWLGPRRIYQTVDRLRELSSQTGLNVFCRNGDVVISLDKDSHVEFFDLMGRKIRQADLSQGIHTIKGLPSGACIVHTGDTFGKVMID